MCAYEIFRFVAPRKHTASTYEDPSVNIFQHTLSIFCEPNETRKYIYDQSQGGATVGRAYSTERKNQIYVHDFGRET
jgi:hypothetical protein